MSIADSTGVDSIHPNVLGTLGSTPLVRLNRVKDGLEADLVAKVEFFNPGGSVKDRIGLAIIEDAERSGKLKPGGTIVEATSGNTGVGLAIAAAIKGYRTVFVMPDKMSREKIQVLRAFSSRVVITPTAVEPDDPRSYYSVARQIVASTPNSILANQYHNPVNPQAHYETTGPEIWQQTGGRVDVFVAGMGTGGTISGAGRYLKEQNPAIQIVGVDPEGSILHDYFHTGQIGEAHTYRVEGIGEDFLPGTTDFSVIDDIVRVTDQESFFMTRRLVREEGLFVGGSCGAAVVGALKYMRSHQLGRDQRVVVLLPDSGTRYLSKVFDDDWMRENGFFTRDWCQAVVGDVLRAKPHRDLIAVAPDDRMSSVIALMKSHGISQAPVLENGTLRGIVREIDLLEHMLLADHEHTPDETIREIVSPNVVTASPEMPLEMLMSLISEGDVVLVVEGDDMLTGILSKIDVLDYIVNHCL
ncbi:MAG: cystathionine beta-synthase [Anaerolineae bacterium]